VRERQRKDERFGEKTFGKTNLGFKARVEKQGVR
jgi:hypothetical protein